MNEIIKQCKDLYTLCFYDDSEFKEALFDAYSKDIRYIKEEKVVCMAFCIDVFAGNTKGKYLYAVATDPDYRKKGYMSKLFDAIEQEFKKEYDFLCLHPASEELSRIYEKKGFTKNLKRSIINGSYKPSVLIETAAELKKIRNKLLLEKSIEYSEEYLKLLLLYCNAFCDDIQNPTTLYIEQQGIPVEYICKENSEYVYSSMSKPLSNIKLDNYYFGIALE